MNRELAVKRAANERGPDGYLEARTPTALSAEIRRRALAGELAEVSSMYTHRGMWRVDARLILEPRPRRARWFWPAALLGGAAAVALLVWVLKMLVATLAALLPWMVFALLVLAFAAPTGIKVVQTVVIKR